MPLNKILSFEKSVSSFLFVSISFFEKLVMIQNKKTMVRALHKGHEIYHPCNI